MTNQKVRRCLVCGADLTGAHHSKTLCSKQCRDVWHKQHKNKPDYIAKAKAARHKRESVPANRKKLNADHLEYHHTRMLEPGYRDAVNAGARRRYHKDPVKKADKIAKTVARRRDNPEAKRKAREADARYKAKKRAAAPQKRSLISEAIDFLRERLANGPQLAKPILQQAKASGIGRTTLWNAYTALGVISKKTGKGRPSMWRLPARAKDQKRGTVSEAIDFLRERLACGPQLATAVEAEAEASGISERTLRRARKNILGVIAEKNGRQGPWTWRLP
jgi:hypothetical protein